MILPLYQSFYSLQQIKLHIQQGNYIIYN